MRHWHLPATGALLAGLLWPQATPRLLQGAAPHVELLSSVDALPAHLAEPLEDPQGFSQTETGEYVVLDRRAHTVFAVDAARTRIRRVTQIGTEVGRLLEPGVLSLGANGVFAVADAPGGFERVQYFGLSGTLVGGFYLPRRTTPRFIAGAIVLNGVGALQFVNRGFLLNLPNAGAVISEFDLDGNVTRRIGALRPTGQEADSVLHQALNIGLPLPVPSGGYYFVFQTGVPMLRRYAADGRLLFERHIEGPELDEHVQALPNTWPRRPPGATTVPLVTALVRTAAVDRRGHLWVALTTGYTYVFDERGEKVRTVQFRAAGVLSPTSMTFAPSGRLLVTPGCYEFDVR